MAEVTAPWRFHTGDDKRWADPDFDDSGWSLLKPNESWSAQGYANNDGVGWDRFKALVPTDSGQYALYISAFPDSVQNLR